MASTSPGQILLEEWIKPQHLTQKQFAQKAGISPSTLNRIITGRGRLTKQVAEKLARHLNTTVEFWLNAERQSKM